ncbi:hypothetical protein FRC10_008653 [Ceratobasidium sp. 414]|nr:hypothetical protein FRC10_008653 [Ceratobasidium sp. 414]
MENWADYRSVPAVVFIYCSGQGTGNVVTNILYMYMNLSDKVGPDITTLVQLYLVCLNNIKVQVTLDKMTDATSRI